MIRSLFESTRKLDRRIEKVISFANDENEQLKREITEYVATDNIETELRTTPESARRGARRWHRRGRRVGVWLLRFW